MGILMFFLISFALLFSLGEAIRIELFNNFTIKPIDIFIFFAVLVWGIINKKSLKKQISFKSPLVLPLFAFITVLFVSLFLNFYRYSYEEILVSISYTFRFILYSSLYFIVKSFSPTVKEKIINLLIFTGAFFVTLGFIQYFFYSNLRNLYYSGWDEHMYRLFSTFLDPNFAGAFLVLCSIFLFGLLFYFLAKKLKTRAVFIGIVIIPTLFAVLFTYSRSALIMLFVSFFAFTVLAKKIKWFAGLILFGVVFILISSKNFNIENINLFRIASSEARIDSAKIALKIISENPIYGVGFNAYRYAQVNYGFKDSTGTIKSHADAGTDNSFLFVLATAGIIGLILYLNIFRVIFKKALGVYKKEKNSSMKKYMAAIVISSTAGIAINAFFINSLFYSFILIWLWILLGLIED